MDEKVFLLGMSNRAKVIVRRGRGPPRETEDGLRERITVVETCCANNTMFPPMVIYQGKGLYRGWFDADDEYVDRTAIFAHSDKGFTTNELATRWLVDYFDAWTRDAADGPQRLLILDGHRTHYSIDFVRSAVKNGFTLLSYLATPPTSCSHLMSAYFRSLIKHTALQRTNTLGKPEPASPRSSSLASIHRQSNERTRNRTSKQPGTHVPYTLSTPTPSYSLCFESWDRHKAMEDMPGALRAALAPPRSSWLGRRRRIAANYATNRTLQFASSPILAPRSRTA